MTCAHRACARRVYQHRVCMDHLLSTLEAGRRAVQYYAPEDRLSRLVAEMRRHDVHLTCPGSGRAAHARQDTPARMSPDSRKRET